MLKLSDFLARPPLVADVTKNIPVKLKWAMWRCGVDSFILYLKVA